MYIFNFVCFTIKTMLNVDLYVQFYILSVCVPSCLCPSGMFCARWL